MAKYLIWLLFLLGTNNVFSQSCYCTTSWHTNATFGQSCTANADCWACQPNAYNASWQQAFCPTYQVTCTTSYAEKVESCPVHQSGIKKYRQETKICTNGQVTQGIWQLYSNTCVQDPPTCQTQSQNQTLSCQTGYTGSITQTRSSTCPDPYGNPVWQPWVTTSNTCVKSISNPTNVTSPVSPVSPVNPTSPTATSASPTVTSTVTAPTPADVQNSVVTPTTSPTSQTKSTASETPTQKETPKFKTIPHALSLELFSKPFTQPNVFPDLNISQELPNDIKILQQTYMDLITNGSLFNPDQTEKLNSIARDAVELEQ